MLFVAAFVDQRLQDAVSDLAVLHLFPRVSHETHLLKLLAGLAVLSDTSHFLAGENSVHFGRRISYRLLEDPIVTF
jgi:hypothetical protein